MAVGLMFLGSAEREKSLGMVSYEKIIFGWGKLISFLREVILGKRK